MQSIAVVIPCYRVADKIIDVVSSIGPEVDAIICVDDGCPDASGKLVSETFSDNPRVSVVSHKSNRGVGAAVVTGYRVALEQGVEIIVKLDGDGQMDARLIGRIVAPIIAGEADYTKGNRFHSPESVGNMPWARVVGNAGQSFFAKLSTGYWRVFDPANGFTAIHAKVAKSLPLDKLSERYFFETDMLFRLSTLRAVVVDVPMNAIYGNETSGLSLLHSLATFPFQHGVNFIKRLVYSYFLRDFNMASVNLVLGIPMVSFGLTFGAAVWRQSIVEDSFASSGTVMLAALPIIVGTQLLLNFLACDIESQPSDPIHRRL